MCKCKNPPTTCDSSVDLVKNGGFESPNIPSRTFEHRK